MTDLRFSGQAPTQVARHFLGLLDDVYKIHGMFLDEITALRARIAELETARRLDAGGSASVATVPDVPGCALYVVSLEGLIQSWSGGACAIYGYSVEEVLGRHPDMLRPGQPGLLNVPASQRVDKAGRVFPVHLHHTVVLDTEGHACGRMHLEIPLEKWSGTNGKTLEGGGR